jgi:hypothetical protein
LYGQASIGTGSNRINCKVVSTREKREEGRVKKKGKREERREKSKRRRP